MSRLVSRRRGRTARRASSPTLPTTAGCCRDQAVEAPSPGLLDSEVKLRASRRDGTGMLIGDSRPGWPRCKLGGGLPERLPTAWR